MKTILKVAFAILTVLFCPAVTLASVSISLTPTSIQVLPGGQTQFTATVNGTTNSVVVWSLAGTNCSGIGCGQITNTGLYLAPAKAPSPNVVTVTATSLQDLSVSASAAVIVGTSSDITVSVSPATVSVLAGQQQKFVAFVTGTTLTGVTWKLAGSGCGSSACGALTSDGVYTAPATPPNPAQVTVEAVSVADPSKSGSAVVTVALPVAVSVSPASATVTAGKQQQFTATVTNTGNTAVNWSVAGAGCSGSACGTISSNGLYTAPSSLPSPPRVSVTATSVADSTKSGTATVTIAPPVAISISPTTVQLLTGAQQQFTATVSNTTNTAVTWSVAGSGCSGAACGTISTSGLYTAPSAVPTPAQVYVTATSSADPTKSSTASVNLSAPVSVAISPTTAQVIVGKQQQFTATVSNTTNTAVTWSVSGSTCSGASCGTISSSGLYTAPATPPNPNQVTVTATSVADTTKKAQALVTINNTVSVTLSPSSAQIPLGVNQQFTATVQGSTNQTVSWSVTGSGCTGSACGIVSSTGLYTAPLVLPNPAQVFVTATAAADPTKSSTASVTLVQPIVVTISPTTANVIAGGHQQFTTTVSNTTNTSVTWTVSGAGCSGSACGVISSTGSYTAPSTVPSPAQVTIKVSSAADSTRYATATVTIVAPVVVSISPATVSVVAGKQQQFSATVTGTTNTAVTWSVSGTGCSGAACGIMNSAGLYSAPGSVPSPAQVKVVATSVADTTKSASATVTILPPVGVSVSPSSVQVVEGGHQQFTASVSGTQNAAVNWSVSGAGCSGAACGTITTAGLYTAPGSIPNPSQVTVTATSSADSTKSGSATVNIIPPVVVTISPSTATIAVNTQQQFQAQVAGSTNTSVDWSLSGAGCSGATCGTISSSGLYTAPAGIPSPATVIVKASSAIDVNQSASATVTIVPSPNARLQGQYAFEFTGSDSGGIYQAAGSFTADGNGNLKGGIEDVNSVAGPSSDVSFTGTYQIGGDNRGTFTLSTPTGAQTFSVALNLAGTSGRFIEFDTTGIRGSGILEKQDPSAFSLAALKGAYVMSLTGKDSAGSRIGALAVVDLTGAGNIAAGSMDANDGGNVPPTFASVNGLYRVDTTGRGLLTLDVPGFEGGAFRFTFYIVNSGKLFLVSTDRLTSANPIFGGPMELQSGAPYLNSSFDGPTVFSLSGVQGTVPQVTVGRIVFDGNSQPLVQFDQNTGGTVTTGNVLTGAYAVEVNGPGTLNLDDSNGHSRVWEMYAIGPNHAFLMDASTADVGMGELQSQSTQAPFTNGDILGTYLLGSGELTVPGAPLYSGVTNFDGRNSVTGTEDISQTSGLVRGQTLSGTYSVSSSANDGSGMLLLSAGSPKSIALWVTSTSEVLGLEIDSANPQPVVLYFEQ